MSSTTMPREQRELVCQCALDDVDALEKAHDSYGDSWKKRGGVGAFMMLARKWDRIENQLSNEEQQYDVLEKLIAEMVDKKEDGLLDDIRDLRRYLLLCESEAIAQAAIVEHELTTEDIVGTQCCDPEEGDADRNYVNQD